MGVRTIRSKLVWISMLAVILIIVVGKALCSPPVVPKAYAIAEINVTDPNADEKYLHAVTPVVSHFGGKYLVRAGTVVPLEGEAPTGRVVVIEFPAWRPRSLSNLRQSIERLHPFVRGPHEAGFFSWKELRSRDRCRAGLAARAWRVITMKLKPGLGNF